MTLMTKLRQQGVSQLTHKVINLAKHRSGWYKWRYRNASQYQDPTPAELLQIESDLKVLGIAVSDYCTSPSTFHEFVAKQYFPPDYHGGKSGGVWHEKLLEHWISWECLELQNYQANDIYVDVAAAGSPWVKALREKHSIQAYAVDLGSIGEEYIHLPYYRVENATKMSFADDSIRGMSLHCAYEMFTADDDINLIDEIARVLRKGGKAIILPLYMHTHYCAYASPNFFGKGYADAKSKEYVRINASWIPSSRKYNSSVLKERILDRISSLGMTYSLSVLRNKADFGENIYCHFILEIQR
jgi:hypothetical protein